MDFKRFLCWFFVTVILHLVYSQDSTSSGPFLKSELACQRYQLLRENFQKVNKSCDKEKLIGGTDCKINEFPHVVAIGYTDENGGSNYVLGCSGSLISEKFVLTAAQCVNRKNNVPRIVRLGKTSLNDGQDCNDAFDINIISASKNIHKDYNERTNHNDIALLELMDTVDQYFSLSLFPACLHYESGSISDLVLSSCRRQKTFSNALDGRDHSFQKTTNWLQKISMQEMTIDSCRESFNETSIIIVESQICATSPTHANISCKVYSGSPLQYKFDDSYYVYGFASCGPPCGAKFSDLYTRVSSYIGWIESIVWP